MATDTAPLPAAPERHIYHHVEPPGITVKLDRGEHGGYGWEIRATAATVDAVLALLEDADSELRAAYGGTE